MSGAYECSDENTMHRSASPPARPASPSDAPDQHDLEGTRRKLLASAVVLTHAIRMAEDSSAGAVRDVRRELSAAEVRAVTSLVERSVDALVAEDCDRFRLLAALHPPAASGRALLPAPAPVGVRR